MFSTLAGGLLAVLFRRASAIFIALGAGFLLGAAFLDLLPEALSFGVQGDLAAAQVLGITLASLFFFSCMQALLDAMALRWKSSSRTMGRVSAVMLIFHSLRDGMGIGLSYAVSHPAGYAVAAGIAAHDIGDGMNTVLLTTRGNRPAMSDYLFLLADSIAPLVGGLLTIWWTFSIRSSAALLAIAAGFFIQMATGDFLPEIRRSQRPVPWMLTAVIFGAAFIYCANLLAGCFH